MQPVKGVVIRPRGQLPRRATRRQRIIMRQLAHGEPETDHLPQRIGIGGLPGRVMARIVDRHKKPGALLRRHVLKLVQGIGSPARPTGRCAGQNQPSDLFGMAKRQMLRDHTAKGNTQHMGAFPTDRAHQGCCIVSIIFHPIVLARLVRLA